MVHRDLIPLARRLSDIHAEPMPAGMEPDDFHRSVIALTWGAVRRYLFPGETVPQSELARRTRRKLWIYDYAELEDLRLDFEESLRQKEGRCLTSER